MFPFKYGFTKQRFYSTLRYAALLATMVYLLHPDRNARGHYNHIPREQIFHDLVFEVSSNLSSSLGLPECDYESVLQEGTLTPEPPVIPSLSSQNGLVKTGGEYVPQDCLPQMSTAVVVPYRDRPEQLHSLLIYMHNFLRRQNIHYRIYVVEQMNIKPFNRAKLLNIGALYAMRDGFPCLILHDVDLIPLHTSNMYACTRQPRHMSASINKFRYTLPYLTLFGGAVSILSSQFKHINGMSNSYWGWGAEDDDLTRRLSERGLELCRFDPDLSRYYMAMHKAEDKRKMNKQLLSEASSRIDSDGLNTLQYQVVSTVLHPLFTHILVDV